MFLSRSKSTWSDLMVSGAAGTKRGATRLADPHRERHAWDHPAAGDPGVLLQHQM